VSESAVVLEDVGVVRGRVRILQHVSARIPVGELVGIVGPNGAGKTTLLRLLNRLIRASSGSVHVLGSPVDALRGAALARLRRRIGYVPQLADTTGSIPIRVREVVEMGRSGAPGLLRRLSEEDHALAGEWIDRLGIRHLADRLYEDLSGGEQRKVHLARALAQGPEILLLDEPTSNLDPRWQAEIYSIVERIWNDLGLTVFFVTHEVHLLPPSTRRVMLLSAGRLHGDGPPEAVFDPVRLTEVFGVPVEVMERAGRRYLITRAPAHREAHHNA